MLFVKLNGVDITEKVELKSIKITEQLGNRANTCTFTVLDHPVPESALIEVWEGSELTQQELSSASVLHLDEMYEYFKKYRIGDELRIPAGSANAKKVTIQSIDHPGKTLTIVGTLGTTYPENTKVGRLIFAGVSQKNPDDEIACGVFVYKVQATDWTKAFDAKNVVDTFEDQYPREIIGRTVHKFTAPDKFLEITDAETTTGWSVPSGVWVAPGTSMTDRAYKNSSVTGWASGAGTIIYQARKWDLPFDNEFLWSLNDADPAGWKTGWSPDITFENTWVDGGRCMKITLSAWNYREVFSHFAWYFWTGGYNIKPNTKYVIRGWIRLLWTGTAQYGARIWLICSDISWSPAWEEFIDVNSDNGWWTFYEKIFTTSSTAATAHSISHFYNHGTSTFVWNASFDKFTISEVINLTSYSHIRPWLKIGAWQLSKLTAPKFRAITSNWNYLEWTDMVQCEDCWSYDSFEIANGVKTGAPNLTDIICFEYQWTVSTAITSGGIKFDQISATTGSFTIRNVIRGTTKYADARAQYKKPTVLMEDLAKLQKLYWYIDYEKDLHFFERETYTCPMEILDSGLVYDDLSVSSDTTQLRNRQVVRGGEAIDGSLYTQDEVTDGKMESWRLDYKPKNLEIDISTDWGTTWIPKTVGVKNLHDPADYQYLFDFNEKVVERASDGILADGVVFRRKYYPYRPIRVQVESAASINKTKALLGGDGIYDGPVINDSSIRSFEDARARAKAELAIYANAVITASWVSQQDGWHAGQIVHIQDSNRSMDDSFVIQKVDRQQKTDGVWQYSVTAGTSMFGLTEFFQLLLRRSEKMMIDVSELVDVVKTIDETIILSDSWRFVKRGPPWYAHTNNQQYNGTITGTEGGTANDAYADFCEAA